MGTRPTHPILLYFGDTAKIDLPVVLMIGREPNTHHQIVPGAGPYDFREYPRAGSGISRMGSLPNRWGVLAIS